MSISQILQDHLDLLALVARADGKVVFDESDLLGHLIHLHNVPSEDVDRIAEILDVQKEVDADAVVEKMAKRMLPLALVDAVRDAYIMAHADEDLDEYEIELIDKLLQHVGFDEAGRKRLHEWGVKVAKHQLEGQDIVSDVWPIQSPDAT